VFRCEFDEPAAAVEFNAFVLIDWKTSVQAAARRFQKQDEPQA